MMLPYTDKPNIQDWVKKLKATLGSSIPDLSDVEPRAVVSGEELKASWPRRWTDKFSEAELMESQKFGDEWAEIVRKEMVHCWRGYKSQAWGRDEVRPISGGSHNWVGIGITLIDSLDTLWVMDLKKEFEEGEDWVRNSLNLGRMGGSHQSLFETTIRGLGGLLSAYSLSGSKIFLDKAEDLGKRLMRAFSPDSPLPKPQVDINSGSTRWMSWSSSSNIAEAGTLQMEFRHLAAMTGNVDFWKIPDRAFMTIVQQSEMANKGLVPIYIGSRSNPGMTGFVGSKISLGAMGDSYYEYLIKQWIQGGKRDTRYKNVWIKAMNEMMDRITVKTKKGHYFIAEESGGRRMDRMDHLVCFVPGMLLLGITELPPEEVDPRWLPAAEGVAETCYKMYKLTASGLSPEYVRFDVNGETDIILPGDAPHNLLRPEAIEALYYMHWYTGDPKYRKWAAEMFGAFKTYSKEKYGYTALRDVRSPSIKNNQQESFFMAETMKYFYLIFAPRTALDLSQYIITTEAHPLKYPISFPGSPSQVEGQGQPQMQGQQPQGNQQWQQNLNGKGPGPR